MTIQQFQLFSQTQPFEPFAIHLADGRHFVVLHPDSAMLTGKARIVQVVNEDGRIEVIDMLLVTSLRPLAGRSSAPTSG